MKFLGVKLENQLTVDSVAHIAVVVFLAGALYYEFKAHVTAPAHSQASIDIRALATQVTALATVTGEQTKQIDRLIESRDRILEQRANANGSR